MSTHSKRSPSVIPSTDMKENTMQDAKIIQDLNTKFSKAQQLMKDTLIKVDKLLNSKTGNIVFYSVIFFLIVFMILYRISK